MDADSDQHAPKRKVVCSAYLQVLQMVVVEDAVIYPLAGSAFLVNIFVFLGIPRYARLEAEVAVVFYVNAAPIAAGGAFAGIWAFINAAAFERAAVLFRIFCGIVSPWTHFVSGPADRMPILVEGDVPGSVCRSFRAPVDVDQRIDVPSFQEFIGRDVVMRRIKADVFRGNVRAVASEIIYGIEEVLAVVAARACKFHQERKLNLELVIPAAQHIERMAEIP